MEKKDGGEKQDDVDEAIAEATGFLEEEMGPLDTDARIKKFFPNEREPRPLSGKDLEMIRKANAAKGG